MNVSPCPQFIPNQPAVPPWALMASLVLGLSSLACGLSRVSFSASSPFMLFGVVLVLLSLAIGIIFLIKITKARDEFLATLSCLELISMIGRENYSEVETGAVLAVLEARFPGWRDRIS